jgi:acetolactate synthase-1/2/3 large subunit
MPLWYIAAKQAFRADAATALKQLNAAMDAREADSERVEERRRFWRDRHDKRNAALAALEQPGDGHPTPEFVTAAVRKHVDDDTIVLNEGVTSYPAIQNHMRMNRPGSIFASGGGSLGWSGGAAIGAKLAAPGKTVMALTGDGSYMFSVPSSVHWMARRYDTPFLTIIYNNRGWKAPRFSTLAVHPDGYASRSDDIGVAFDPVPDYSAIAAASGGAFARKVERPEEVEATVAEAVKVVREERRSAVLDVCLAHL